LIAGGGRVHKRLRFPHSRFNPSLIVSWGSVHKGALVDRKDIKNLQREYPPRFKGVLILRQKTSFREGAVLDFVSDQKMEGPRGSTKMNPSPVCSVSGEGGCEAKGPCFSGGQ